MPDATYVYCLVSSVREPSAARAPRGLRGTGRPRLLDVSSGRSRRWLVVADAPLSRYGEAAIKKGLTNLDWVSRAALAHEAVVEAFIAAPAVLPMKLFTLFANDERARDHVRNDWKRIDRIVTRVANHHEWGVRVMLDTRRLASQPVVSRSRVVHGGVGYLAHKKAQRDARSERARNARQTVDQLFEDLEPLTADARRRRASDFPVQGGPLLLDAAFLVRKSGAARFRRRVQRWARALRPNGYSIRLTGPWPPYAFVGD